VITRPAVSYPILYYHMPSHPIISYPTTLCHPFPISSTVFLHFLPLPPFLSTTQTIPYLLLFSFPNPNSNLFYFHPLLSTHHSFPFTALHCTPKYFSSCPPTLNSQPATKMPGQSGGHKTILLELKLIADVGLVGFPNVSRGGEGKRIEERRGELSRQ
jgi:hypothetical protein